VELEMALDLVRELCVALRSAEQADRLTHPPT
jgi:hypothetical protein